MASTLDAMPKAAKNKPPEPKNPLDVIIGKRIAELRTDAGLSQMDVADKTNIEKSALGNYEQGTRRVSIEVATELGQAFGVSAAHVLCLDGDLETSLRPSTTPAFRTQSRMPTQR